jgi:hypothetical protein
MYSYRGIVYTKHLPSHGEAYPITRASKRPLLSLIPALTPSSPVPLFRSIPNFRDVYNYIRSNLESDAQGKAPVLPALE